ncbi:hypothetical protein BLA24_29755 [Streptomyces cinnamoneus]|uniref:Uncharacterized protein n=1 Tax=Streptomyces cinnamoneus TaxID=53446 RepID=A0A2G1XBD0_STRCJ|nr:hypothetical protein [Streptomyces cinnamoneus]PHQ48538.1 hypothetical protein BLA24_29755 [Streptomyces cinnamoneus]PPT12462.1 hypothetical protein CYQ11_05720 [Streptomyces cinnamoneus]
MNRVRTALAALVVAAFALPPAATATAAPSGSDDSDSSGSSISSRGTTQRGREITFTVTTSQSVLDDNGGRLTVESPAFAKKLTLKAKRFREGKDGSLYTQVAGMVLCDIQPGTYPVELKAGDDEPEDTDEMTVVADMDPGNRDFCDSPRNYDEVVDRTSETAPDDDSDDDDTTIGPGALAAVIAGTAALAAALASAATYLLTRRRGRGGDGGSGDGGKGETPQDPKP